jgi:anaerobic ribonucleoside-triphosphate reductase activating protein
LRGSDNQKIIYRDAEIEAKYTGYLANFTNQIQNFRSRDGVISVGIHRPGYNEEIKNRLQEKGVLTGE